MLKFQPFCQNDVATFFPQKTCSSFVCVQKITYHYSWQADVCQGQIFFPHSLEEITHPIYGEIKKQDMVLLRNKPVKFEWNRNYFIVTPQYMYI